MNIEHHTHPSQLERYSFLYSEIRLVVAAVALLLGGVPVLIFVLPVPALYQVIRLVLTVTWILSGVSSGYLLYRWNQNHKKLFGGNTTKDIVAFFVSTISGINLGLAGILGTNIGMSIFSNRPVFTIVALVYLISAVHLFMRWQSFGKKIF